MRLILSILHLQYQILAVFCKIFELNFNYYKVINNIKIVFNIRNSMYFDIGKKGTFFMYYCSLFYIRNSIMNIKNSFFNITKTMQFKYWKINF